MHRLRGMLWFVDLGRIWWDEHEHARQFTSTRCLSQQFGQKLLKYLRNTCFTKHPIASRPSLLAALYTRALACSRTDSFSLRRVCACCAGAPTPTYPANPKHGEQADQPAKHPPSEPASRPCLHPPCGSQEGQDHWIYFFQKQSPGMRWFRLSSQTCSTRERTRSCYKPVIQDTRVLVHPITEHE